MKAHWPVEFMAALLTYEMDSTDKIVEYISECMGMGVEVLPPDINESGVNFTPLYQEKDGQKKEVIRFGLAAVKGVGEKAVEQIIVARDKVGRFRSLFHFCEHVDLRAVNKQVMEALIKAGAFDRLGGNRHQMMAGLERAMECGASLQLDKLKGQMNFFGQMAAEDKYEEDHQRLPDVPPWPEPQMLAFEKQVLGFYVTSNPLSHHAEEINIYSTVNTSLLADIKQDREIIIGGMVTRIRYNIIKNGKNAGAKMAVFVLEDLQGQAEVVLFPRTLNAYGALLAEDKVLFVRGNVDHRREKPNILADELIALEEVREKLSARVAIRLDAEDVTQEKVARIRSVCENHRGRSSLFLAIQTNKGKVYANADARLKVHPSMDFIHQMRQVVGDNNIVLTK
jgi:DNA polymerase-3 subunit alpha